MNKNVVEGLSLALLGAFSGGSQDKLSDQLAKLGPKATADSLIAVQSKLLKINLTSDETWVDQVLSNLGMTQQSQLYVSAKVWFLLQSALGRERSIVVTDVVDFLLATANSHNPDPKYAELALTFLGDVNNGVKWSATQPQSMSGELLADFDKLRTQVKESRIVALDSINNSVSGLTIALFGAYAGAYFNELASQAKIKGIDVLANNLTVMQTSIKFPNTDTNDGWTDFVIKNLGIEKSEPAYSGAKAWFMSAIQTGGSRSQVVSDATDYLINLSKNPGSDQIYATQASEFFAKVAEGVRWSQDASSKGGANVRDLSVLQNQYKTLGNQIVQESKYTEILKPLFAGMYALSQNKNQSSSGSSYVIEKAEIDAEQAIRDALSTSEFIYNQDESSNGQSAKANELEDAAEKIARESWEQIKLEQLSQVSIKKQILNKFSTQANVLVEKYSNLSADLYTNNDQFYQSEDRLLSILERGTTDFPAGTLAYDFNIDGRELSLLHVQEDGDIIVASYSGSTWVNGPAYRPSAESIKEASVEYFVKYVEYLKLEEELVQLIKSIERIDSSLTNAQSVEEIDAYTYLSEDADKYLAALAEWTEQSKLIDNAESALAKVKELRTADAASVIQSSLDAEIKKLEDEGVNYIKLENALKVSSTSGDDVFDALSLNGVVSSCDINDFGISGEDVLVLYGFKKAENAFGIDSAYEYKVEKISNGVVIRLETKQNSFANVSNNTEISSINLIGVDANRLLMLDDFIAFK